MSSENEEDKHPKKFSLTEISAYTINGETAKVLHEYKPFINDERYITIWLRLRNWRMEESNYQITNAVKSSYIVVNGIPFAKVWTDKSIDPVLYLLEDASDHL